MQKVNATSLVKLIAIVLAVALLAVFSVKPVTEKINLGLDLQGGLHVVMEAQEQEGQKISEDTISKSIGILRTRVDQLGVAEAPIQPAGSNRIIIELPGVEDPDAAADFIGQTAELQFKDENGNVVLSGKNLQDAKAELDPGSNQPQVSLKFDEEGAQIFKDFSSQNIGKHMGIYLDDKMFTNPVISETIPDGNARISGGFETLKEAEDTAVLLRSGALPVTINIVEKRTVGPTLGSDSLAKSVEAGIVGLIMILVFMIGYYRVPGLVAAVSLVLYSCIVLWVMILLNATLTLPGIAGFILSIGMAVDANIIIYERIKDEMRHGKTLKASIEAGFNRAFWTVFDANITTLLVAGVLMFFGIGPIKGFAVTLSIGIIASLFTAIAFTRFLLRIVADVWTNTNLYVVMGGDK
ncbi:MAG: protein translocase subunit SecD [Syntrophomonadaceae bacterium]|nr:protein translocase subunit SecD [Syntrophomonadaceae bacterium]